MTGLKHPQLRPGIAGRTQIFVAQLAEEMREVENECLEILSRVEWLFAVDV